VSRKLAVDVVRDALRERVAGSCAPGDRMPPEADLAREYGVSRLTLREAVRGLVEEGYLTRRQGDGTFVTQRPRLRNNLDVNFGVTQLVESMGMTPGSVPIDVREQPAGEEEAQALGLSPGTTVVRVERVRTADGTPLVYSVEFLPARLMPAPFAVERFQGSLYAELRAAGVAIHHAVSHLAAVAARRGQARHLDVKLGAPLLLLTQVDYTEADQACLYTREWYVSSRVDMRVYRRGARTPDQGVSTLSTKRPASARAAVKRSVSASPSSTSATS
jgi:DNA-binding GntR family transcriptional regulator